MKINALSVTLTLALGFATNATAQSGFKVSPLFASESVGHLAFANNGGDYVEDNFSGSGAGDLLTVHFADSSTKTISANDLGEKDLAHVSVHGVSGKDVLISIKGSPAKLLLSKADGRIISLYEDSKEADEDEALIDGSINQAGEVAVLRAGISKKGIIGNIRVLRIANGITSQVVASAKMKKQFDISPLGVLIDEEGSIYASWFFDRVKIFKQTVNGQLTAFHLGKKHYYNGLSLKQVSAGKILATGKDEGYMGFQLASNVGRPATLLTTSGGVLSSARFDAISKNGSLARGLSNKYRTLVVADPAGNSLNFTCNTSLIPNKSGMHVRALLDDGSMIVETYSARVSKTLKLTPVASGADCI